MVEQQSWLKRHQPILIVCSIFLFFTILFFIFNDKGQAINQQARTQQAQKDAQLKLEKEQNTPTQTTTQIIMDANDTTTTLINNDFKNLVVDQIGVFGAKIVSNTGIIVSVIMLGFIISVCVKLMNNSK